MRLHRTLWTSALVICAFALPRWALAQGANYPEASVAPAQSVGSAASPTPGWAQPRIGIELTFLGPNSLVGGGLAYQPIRWVELMLWGGYNHATAAGRTDLAYAEASISVLTGMARARIWPLEKHSIVVDTGLGLTHMSMSANGHGILTSNATDTLEYRRSGTPGLANLGLGYGYRSNSEFRVAVILGALFHTTQLPTGTVTSGGSFAETDRANLRTSLDDAGNPLTKVRAYLDVSVGFLF